MQDSFCHSHPKNYQIPQSSSLSSVLDGLRVLVVDDDLNNLDLLKIVFEQYQVQVNVATSVDKAIEVIEEWKPNILISDLSIPNKDGYSLIRSIRIKEAEVGGFLPALALTGWVCPRNFSLALNAGYQIVIPKPFDSEDLVAVVAKLTA
jgi:CheY-like chemotaxis protein